VRASRVSTGPIFLWPRNTERNAAKVLQKSGRREVSRDECVFVRQAGSSVPH
jgi:hypothetical protein